MRVGIIIYGSINTITGGYIYDHKLVNYLESNQVIVKIFSQPRKSLLGSIKNNFSRKLLRDILSFSPDILLEDEMNFISLFLFNKKIKRYSRFPIISIVHQIHSKTGSYFIRKISKKIEKLYLKSVNGFIFNSHSTKKEVINIIGECTRSIVAYPGKDRLEIKNITSNNAFQYYTDKLMIIFIGNLIFNKGLHLLIRALAEIETKYWQLSIVGNLQCDVLYSKKIFNMISRLRLKDNVNVLGLLDRVSLTKELKSHHLLAIPSYYESFGMAYLEAMGVGLPVIASNTGGASEFVADSKNGFLIEPGNLFMLKDAINKFINNPLLLHQMSVCSLETYKNMPSWDETMKKVHEFLLNFKSKSNLISIQ